MGGEVNPTKRLLRIMKRGKTQFIRSVKEKRIKLGRFLTAHGASEYTVVIFVSLIIGVVAGLAAVGFHSAINLFNRVFWNENKNHAVTLWLVVIFLPAAGMLIQWLMRKIAPEEAEKKSVLDAIKAVSIRHGLIPLKTTLFHFLAPVICIGTGNTVGPEAPAAQTGAGAVSAVGRLMGLSKSRLRIVTAAGAGAAIAGVFNTPLAGVFFAIEVILLNDFRASALGIILLSSVSASAVSRTFLGNAPKFFFSTLDLGPYPHFIFYLVLGIGAGFLSIAFIKASEFGYSRFKQLYKHVPRLPVMLFIGVLMGIAGWLKPEILGVGYESINSILSHSLTVHTIVVLFVMKFCLVILILRSGGFGGIFAPSIFMGACYGFLFAFTFSELFHFPLDLTTYTLVGMGALLAGINSVPITAIMMLFEMTNDYYFILPLMLGVVGSHTITRVFMRDSIYQRELSHEGYRFMSGRETRILQSIPVRQVADRDILALPESTPIAEVVRRFIDEPHDTVYTLDEVGKLSGVITSSTLHHLIVSYEDLRGVLIAKDIAEPDFVLLDGEDNLDHAMQIFAKERIEEIPIIDSKKANEVIGTLHYQDVINAYNQHAGMHSLKDGLADDLKSVADKEICELIPGFSLAEIELPEKFINKTLAQLNLRNLFKIDVLMVERTGPFEDEDLPPERLMPDRTMILNRGDKLIVYGRTLDVVRFQNYFD